MLVAANRLRRAVCARGDCDSERRRRKRVYSDSNPYHPRKFFSKKSKSGNSPAQILPKKDPLIRRSLYSRIYRPERTLISLCENTYMTIFNQKQYRACRYVYYFGIPYLARNIWYAPDRDRIYQLEATFYQMLLSYRFVKGLKNRHPRPNRIREWLYFGQYGLQSAVPS